MANGPRVRRRIQAENDDTTTQSDEREVASNYTSAGLAGGDYVNQLEGRGRIGFSRARAQGSEEHQCYSEDPSPERRHLRCRNGSGPRRAHA